MVGNDLCVAPVVVLVHIQYDTRRPMGVVCTVIYLYITDEQFPLFVSDKGGFMSPYAWR